MMDSTQILILAILGGLMKTSIRKQQGAAMIEYGLIVALIALVAIAGITLIGTNASALFNNVAGSL
jgi:pilus assembly protein Flp/PilA